MYTHVKPQSGKPLLFQKCGSHACLFLKNSPVWIIFLLELIDLSGFQLDVYIFLSHRHLLCHFSMGSIFSNRNNWLIVLCHTVQSGMISWIVPPRYYFENILENATELIDFTDDFIREGFLMWWIVECMNRKAKWKAMAINWRILNVLAEVHPLDMI